MMHKLLTTLFFALIVFTGKAQTEKDIIYLKNGSKLRGTITYHSDSVTNIIVVAGSIWSIPSLYISRIGKQKPINAQPDSTNYFMQDKSIHSTNKQSRYNLITNIGVYFPVSGSKSSYFHCSMINAYSILPNFSAGIGIGIERDVKSYYPIFGDLRYYLNMKSFAPFISLSCGKAFAWNKKEVFYWQELKNTGGPYVNASIGTEFPLKEKLSLLISLDYKYQKSTYKSLPGDQYYELIEETNRIGVKLGLLFH